MKARDPNGAKTIIDYYGGKGFFDALPENVRAYCTATAMVNALGWHTGMSYRPDLKRLAALDCLITLAYGSITTAAMKTLTGLLGHYLQKCGYAR